MTRIRGAAPGDLAVLRELLASAHLPADDLTEAALEHFMIWPEADSLVGVVGLEPQGKTALLRSLAVHEDFQGQGIGARLVAAAETRARALGVTGLYLLTTTAAHFFDQRGYGRLAREAAPTAIRATTQFSALCPATAVLMCKALADGAAA